MTMNKRSIWSPMQRPRAGYDAQGHGPVYGAFQGGMPQIHPDKGQDYVDAKLRPGEYVLRPEAVQAMGGPQQVDKMNAMGGPNRPQQFGPMTPPPPLGSGGMAPPPMHNFEQNMMDFVPSPVSEVTKRDRHGNQTTIKYDTKASQGNPQEFYGGGPVYAQGGGWLDNVLNWQGLSGDGPTVGQKIGVQPGYWYGTDEEEERNAALQARPGIRPGDDLNPVLSDAVNDAAYAKISTAATGEFSDESLMANSSSNKVDTVIKAAAGAQTQLEGTPWAGYEGYGQQDYVAESQPRNIEGGSADPSAQAWYPEVPALPGTSVSLNTSESNVENPVVEYDPFTGQAILADGQVLTDPTPQQLQASDARADSELAVDRVVPKIEQTTAAVPKNYGDMSINELYGELQGVTDPATNVEIQAVISAKEAAKAREDAGITQSRKEPITAEEVAAIRSGETTPFTVPTDLPEQGSEALDPAFQKSLREAEAKRAEGFRVAEDKIASMTGMNTQSLTNEQVKQTETSVNNALNKAGYKELADSLSEEGILNVGGKGVDQKKVKEIIDNADAGASRGPYTKDSPSGFDGVKGMLTNVFKDLFGTDDFKKVLMRGLIMYAGGRLTGMSGNQALALAAKDGLAAGDRVRAKAEEKQKTIDARKAGVQKLKAETIDWSKAQSPEYKDALQKYYETGEFEGLPQLPEEVEVAEQFTLGQASSNSLYVGGVGEVPIHKDGSGKGAYISALDIQKIDPSYTGGHMSEQQFRAKYGNQVHVTHYDKNLHDQETSRGHFTDIAQGHVDKHNTMNSNRDGQKANKVAVNTQQIGADANIFFQETLAKYPHLKGNKVKDLLGNGIDNYIKAKNDFINGNSKTDPGSVTAYLNDLMIKAEYKLPNKWVANTPPVHTLELSNNLDALIAAETGASVGSAEFRKEQQDTWAELSKGWKAIMNDKEKRDYWFGVAGYDVKKGVPGDNFNGVDPFILYSNASLGGANADIALEHNNEIFKTNK